MSFFGAATQHDLMGDHYNLAYKEYLLSIIKDAYHYFNNELKEFGDIYIAGGAVRDYFIGREPKDYDIFVLCAKNSDIKNIEYQINNKIKLERVKNIDLNSSCKISCCDLSFNKLNCQIIVKDMTIQELMDSFDWDFCCCYFDGNNIKYDKKVCDFEILSQYFKSGQDRGDKNKYFINLNKINGDPIYTIQRGFYFKYKYGVSLSRWDILKLCEAAIEYRTIKI